MDLLALFRDASWGFAGAVLSLVAVLVAVWAVIRETKAIEVAVDERQLVGIRDDLGGKLQLLFDGVPKSEIWLVTISFLKRGVRPVSPDDFHGPVAIRVGTGKTEVLKYSVQDAHPEQLVVKCTQADSHVVAISPLLLNAGDRFSVALLVSDYAPTGLRFDYRIAGVPSITRVNHFQRKRFVPNWFGNVFAMCITVWVLGKFDPKIGAAPLGVLTSVAVIFATVMTVVEVWVVRPVFRRWGHKFRWMLPLDT